MQRIAARDTVFEGLIAVASRRWRTATALAAGLVIMGVMLVLGWFDGDGNTGIQWAYVAVYLCGVIVAAMQVDRLFGPTD